MTARRPRRSTSAAATVLLAVAALLLGSCTGSTRVAEAPDGPGSPSTPGAAAASPSAPGAAPPPADGGPGGGADGEPSGVTADPVIRPIPRHQWERILAAGVWRPGCPISRGELRRVEINHYTFDGTIRRGVLVVNRDVAASVSRIFTRLFEARFPIRKMRPVEVYGGDVQASLRDDNTSAYNCRRPDQINAPPMESPHANGRAVDINPVENPWKDLRCDCWVPNRRNSPREPGPGVIRKGGLVWRAFRDEGWIWQNIDVPDYMHFDTGYPSRPFKDRARDRSGTQGGAR